MPTGDTVIIQQKATTATAAYFSRQLETTGVDNQHMVHFMTLMMQALELVRNALGVVVDDNERQVNDPTDALLAGDVRVPEL